MTRVCSKCGHELRRTKVETNGSFVRGYWACTFKNCTNYKLVVFISEDDKH